MHLVAVGNPSASPSSAVFQIGCTPQKHDPHLIFGREIFVFPAPLVAASGNLSLAEKRKQNTITISKQNMSKVLLFQYNYK